jgi:transcriptional regulator with XRE-family HTH domain
MKDPGYQRVVALLREARLRAGLTQVQVGKRLKRPQSYVSSCESGQHRIDIVELREFAKLYGASLQRFLKAIED